MQSVERPTHIVINASIHRHDITFITPNGNLANRIRVRFSLWLLKSRGNVATVQLTGVRAGNKVGFVLSKLAKPRYNMASRKEPTETVSEYLERHHVLTYMEDAINQLLQQKDETPKMVPTRFLSDYFRSIHDGTNTLFREYEYIRSTPQNRGRLIACFWKCFNRLAGHGELLSVKEYHSLLCLLCYDFPLEIVQRTAHIVLMEDALDCLMSFIDFMYAFQIQFYYEEYFSLCKEVYEHLVNGSSTVVVPTSDTWNQKKRNVTQASMEAKISEGVQSQAFFEAIEKLRGKLPKGAPQPSSQHVHSELSKSSKTTYYGLLMALSRNEDVNSEIGVLPNRGDAHGTEDND